jgi:dTMP kinase
MLKRGAYVTLDGPDGVGKSNQAMRLAEETGSWLTREPGGHIAQIRDILLNPHIELTPEAEVLLFSADRHITLQRTILPSLGTEIRCFRQKLSEYACVPMLWSWT